MSLVLVSVLLQVTCNGILYINAATVSEAPIPQNVSDGHLVNFTCATTGSHNIITWSTNPNVIDTYLVIQSLPDGGKRSVLSITALLEHHNTTVRCIVIDPITTISTINTALLLVQGLLPPVNSLTSTEVDHCTLRLTWTAPYTLQGVPINYYTINITRHSDGAVLRTDTTNTTEYFYIVSSLGEMVKAEVAAVNDVGIGDNTSFMTQTPSSISAMKFMSSLMNTARDDSVQSTKWTYTLHFEETSVCTNAINHTTVQACMNSSCSEVTNDTVDTLSDSSGRVMATFTNLTENRNNYTATLNIHYNGGVVQQSQPVGNLSTFDVRSATYTVEFGRVCFNVTYVEGHVRPARSFSSFQPSTNMHDGMIDQADNCIDVAPNPSYTIKITDEDAKHEVDTVAPVTILGVSVPEHVSSTQTALPSNTVSTSPPSNDNDIVSIVLPVIGLIAAIIATISLVLCSYCYCKRKLCMYADNKIEHQIEADCHSLSEDHQAIHQLELNDQSSPEIIYTDVGYHSKNTPHQALPVGEVQYGEALMSKGQQDCLKRLAKMKTLPINYATLYELLQPLSLQWRQMGEALLLAPFLHDIQTKNFSDEECLQEVLKCWENKQVRPYTWETLVTVLNSSDIRATYLATELSKRLTTNSVILYT